MSEPHQPPMPPGAGRAPVVVCFGEALWDVLPEGIFVGGAPLNVAYHLVRQGVRAVLVSAVGDDFLGDELRRRARAWGVDHRGIARVPPRPTGTVCAALDPDGIASYRIARRVAWDQIPFPRPRARSAPAALVFGTLALREEPNRRTLERLLAAWPHALRVLDLNLRPPFTARRTLRFALRHAQLLKLNDQELAALHGQPAQTPDELERAARHLAGVHRLTRICVTAGARGAGLLWDDGWHWENARPVAVRDTVGAGDGFLAALLAALLARGATPAAALAGACRIGEFVAARSGATPPYAVDAAGRPHEPEPTPAAGFDSQPGRDDARS